MKYPHDFPSASRAVVVAERLRAGKDFDNVRSNPPWVAHVTEYLKGQLQRYVMRQVRVFGREACKLGMQGVWDCDLVEKSTLEFLRLCAIEAEFAKGNGLVGRGWTDNWGGRIREEIMGQFQRSAEFREFQAELLQVADAQAMRTPHDGTDVEKEISAKLPEKPSEPDRREMVDRFLAACNREPGSRFRSYEDKSVASGWT